MTTDANAKFKTLVDIVGDAAAMQLFFNQQFSRNVAIAVSAFWKDAFPILVKMAEDVVPRAMIFHDAVRANPWLQNMDEQLRDAAVQVKKDNPNGTYEENLMRAIELIRPKEDKSDG